MKYIIGLGNPGLQYHKTKHNIGFIAIDMIAKKYNIDINKMKHKGCIGEGYIDGEKVMLIKPLTYMNLSGECAYEIQRFYKADISNFIIIYDDITIEPGLVKIKEKGSAGGHNGIKNIIEHFKTDTFCRLKIGIGQKPKEIKLADYVLGNFSNDDIPKMDNALSTSVFAIEQIITNGVSKAMNAVNTKE